MKTLILIVILIFSFTGIAYIPPMEEIVSQKLMDIETGGASLKIKIEKISEPKSTFYLDLSMFKNANKYIEINQILKTDNNQVIDVKNVKNVNLNSFKLEQGDVNKLIFYSLVFSNFLNEPQLMINFNKSIGGKFKFKNELINQGKTSLMTQYKQYLKNTQTNPSLESPLNPKNRDEQRRATQTYYSNLYAKEDYVSLHKSGEHFYFKIYDEFMEILVEQELRQFKNFKFRSQQGEIEAAFSNFVSFNENKYYPKTIYFKDIGDQSFRIEILDYKIYPIKYEQYSKEKLSAINQANLEKASFLF